MGSGDVNKSKDAQRRNADQQAAVSREWLDFAKQDRAKGEALSQPATDRYTAIASGDKKALLQTTAPEIGAIDASYKAAKEAIMNSVPAGPAREFALAQLEVQRPAAKATYLNTAYTSAFDKLAGIGSEKSSFALNELGGGLRSSEAASNTQSAVLNADVQSRAATLGFLGSLAGMTGNIIGGRLAAGSGGGGGNGNE